MNKILGLLDQSLPIVLDCDIINVHSKFIFFDKANTDHKVFLDVSGFSKLPQLLG